MNECNLKTKDVGKTFIHSSGKDSTAIDYIVYPEVFDESILHMRRLEITSNISDHYPVGANMKFYFSMKNTENISLNNKHASQKVNWSKIDKDQYKQAISDRITDYNIQTDNTEQIDDAVLKLTTAVIDALAAVAPLQKVKKHKPKLKLMTHDIYKAIKAKKSAYCEWNIKGRPQDPTNPLLLHKKITTYELRKICRAENAKLRINDRQKLTEARTMDSKLYYQLIRKQRGKLNRFIDELQVGNNCFKGDENILEGWKLHFANLAKQSEPTNFDQEYFSLIDSEYSQIIEICQEVYDHEVVSTEEFEKAIKKLNRNKSADIFGITTECLIYGGEKLEYMLLNIINASFKHCYITNSLKTGTLSPIFKNKGDIVNSKNYRGITITPTISKLVETIIKLRINPDIIFNQNPMQRGFTENTAPLIASLIMEEYKRENKDLKKPTLFGMLDAKSAFDVVRHTNLIRKLYHMGISEQCILLIDNLYKEATRKIKWKGQISGAFDIEQGVRQGGTLLSVPICTRSMSTNSWIT
ncbi:Hypothetical predicted protein [Mytilus galloprovincialis]|uniref:Reverse transcriptase domain-containing protein n=1 Tax=Mytilus galloprovincialis TaxID=29158 RepID=A0A8B6FB17_MYTGA|nr:Hypothetical predicted protein [Mytilus galloprovincialis]